MAPMRVAEAGHVDTEQLELGRHVGLAELGRAAEQPVGDDLGAGVAGPHQAVAAAVDRGHLADRVDVGIAGGAGRVGEHAAALGESAAGRRGPARRAAAHRRRRPPRRRRSAGAVAEQCTRTRVVAEPFDRVGADAEMHLDAQLADHPVSSAPPASSSCWPSARRRARRRAACKPNWRNAFAASRPSSRRRSPRRPVVRVQGTRWRPPDRVEVVEGAVDVAVRQVVPGYRRHERVRPGGQHQRVVGDAPALRPS